MVHGLGAIVADGRVPMHCCVFHPPPWQRRAEDSAKYVTVMTPDQPLDLDRRLSSYWSQGCDAYLWYGYVV